MTTSSIGRVAVVPDVPIIQNITTIADQAVATGHYGAPVGFYDDHTKTTFVVWMGAGSHPYVQSYSHNSNMWSDAVQVGTNPSQDFHNYPSMIQMQDKRLLVVHPQHFENAPLKIAISPSVSSLVGTLDEWNDREIKAAPAAGYPRVLKTSDGDIYIFYRETSMFVYPDEGLAGDDRPIQYIWSEDNGQTWKTSKDTAGKTAIGSWNDTDNFNSIYLLGAKYQPGFENASGERIPERIHLAWTLAGSGPSKPSGQATTIEPYLKDVYYAFFEPSSKHFFCPSVNTSYEGQIVDLGKSISKNDMQAHCRVENTGYPGGNGYRQEAVDYFQLVSWDSQGRPLIIYHLNHDNGTGIVRSAKWIDSKWIKKDILQGKEALFTQALELERLGNGSLLLYLVDKSLQTYISQDDGDSWNACAKLTLPVGRREFGRIGLIENYKEPVQLLAYEFARVDAPLDTRLDVYAIDMPSCTKEETAPSLPEVP